MNNCIKYHRKLYLSYKENNIKSVLINGMRTRITVEPHCFHLYSNLLAFCTGQIFNNFLWFMDDNEDKSSQGTLQSRLITLFGIKFGA